jgi:phosphoglycerate dehydrogenase-like enzyme
VAPRPPAVLALAPWARDGAFPPDVMRRLTRLVDVDPELTLTSFEPPAPALARAEILISGWGCPRVDATVLDAAPKLRACVHAAGTVKNHLDPVVFERGLLVSSAAAANAVPVAEYTIAAVTLGAKRAFARARSYAADPAVVALSPADTGLLGCTIGVVGASRIGRLVLDGLRRLDVAVLLHDPYLTAREARQLGAEPVALDTLCRRSDILTIHAPALPETHHLLDDRRLALLPDGAVLINTARGSLVDTDALTRECATGRISAILDVTDPEPLPPDHPLLAMPNVFITPHLAGAQGRELRRLGDFATDEVGRLLRGEPLHGQIEAHHLTLHA